MSTCPLHPGCLLDDSSISSYLHALTSTKPAPAAETKKKSTLQTKTLTACQKTLLHPRLDILTRPQLTKAQVQLLLREGENVCRKVISADYLAGEESKTGLSSVDRLFVYWGSYKKVLPKYRTKVVTLKRDPLRNVVCAFAMTQEKEYNNQQGKVKYVYLDVLCSRKDIALGSKLLQEVIHFYQLYNERNPEYSFAHMEIRSLPALTQYYQKRGFAWGSPRFSKPYVLLEGEDIRDGLHMYLNL
jgi:hypothetical protein